MTKNNDYVCDSNVKANVEENWSHTNDRTMKRLKYICYLTVIWLSAILM